MQVVEDQQCFDLSLLMQTDAKCACAAIAVKSDLFWLVTEYM